MGKKNKKLSYTCLCSCSIIISTVVVSGADNRALLVRDDIIYGGCINLCYVSVWNWNWWAWVLAAIFNLPESITCPNQVVSQWLNSVGGAVLCVFVNSQLLDAKLVGAVQVEVWMLLMIQPLCLLLFAGDCGQRWQQQAPLLHHPISVQTIDISWGRAPVSHWSHVLLPLSVFASFLLTIEALRELFKYIFERWHLLTFHLFINPTSRAYLAVPKPLLRIYYSKHDPIYTCFCSVF